MIEFIRKFENRGIKIARVDSILIGKSINSQFYCLILYGLGSFVKEGDFPCIVHLQRSLFGVI